jgi:phosphatidylglycerol lysyltransferase
MATVRRASLISFLVFAAGVINILSSFWAMGRLRLSFLEHYVPLRISNVSRTITVELGILLIFVSYGLWKKKRRAWLLAVLALVPVLVTNMIKGLDFEEALVNSCVLFLLLKDRRIFNVRSQPFTVASTLKTVGLAVLALALYAVVGMYALRGEFRQHMTVKSAWSEYAYITMGVGREQLSPATRRARWLYDSIAFSHTLALILILPALFAPFVNRGFVSEQDRDDALSLIMRTGTNSVSPMAGIPDKTFYFNDDRTCCVAYRVEGGYAIVLGDPIGYEEEKRDMIQEFRDYCYSCGLKPVWYNVEEYMLPYYHGDKHLLIGEEAVINLESFTLKGPCIKDVRNAMTKVEKDNYSFNWHVFAEGANPSIPQITALHEEWLRNKKLSPMTFSLEYYPFPDDQAGEYLTVEQQGKVYCALSFFPYMRGKAYVLDLMLRAPDAPNGLIESAIAKACLYYQKQGIKELNLSLAPLVVSDKNAARNELLDRFERWYRFRPLRSFKDKFCPVWKPKYVVYPSHTDLPGMAIALIRAHTHKPTPKV